MGRRPRLPRLPPHLSLRQIPHHVPPPKSPRRSGRNPCRHVPRTRRQAPSDRSRSRRIGILKTSLSPLHLLGSLRRRLPPPPYHPKKYALSSKIVHRNRTLRLTNFPSAFTSQLGLKHNSTTQWSCRPIRNREVTASPRNSGTLGWGRELPRKCRFAGPANYAGTGRRGPACSDVGRFLRARGRFHSPARAFFLLRHAAQGAPMLHATEIIGAETYDSLGNYVGRVKEMFVEPADQPNRVAHLLLGRGQYRPLVARYDQIASVAPGRISLTTDESALALYHPNEAWLAVGKDLLDQQ